MPKFLKGQERSIDSANKSGTTKAADDKSNREAEKSEKEQINQGKKRTREEFETNTLEVEEPSLLQKATQELKKLLNLEKAETNSKKQKREHNPQPEEPQRAEFTSPLQKLNQLTEDKIKGDLLEIQEMLKGSTPSKEDNDRVKIAEEQRKAEKARQEVAGRDPTKKNV